MHVRLIFTVSSARCNILTQFSPLPSNILRNTDGATAKTLPKKLCGRRTKTKTPHKLSTAHFSHQHCLSLSRGPINISKLLCPLWRTATNILRPPLNDTQPINRNQHHRGGTRHRHGTHRCDTCPVNTNDESTVTPMTNDCRMSWQNRAFSLLILWCYSVSVWCFLWAVQDRISHIRCLLCCVLMVGWSV